MARTGVGEQTEADKSHSITTNQALAARKEIAVVEHPEPDAPDDPRLVQARRDLHESREQFEATSEVLVALGRSSSNNDAVLDTLVRRVCSLCRGDAAMLYLADREQYRLARSVGLSAEFVEYVDRHPLAADRGSLVGRVGLDRRIQQITDVLSDPEYGRYDYQRIAGFRSLVGAPMIVDDKVVGVLSVWRNEVEPFDERIAFLLTTFAAQAAIAINHVELVRALEAGTAELGRKVDQLEALGAVIEAVNSSLDLDQVLAEIVMHAVQLSGTDGGSIMEFDDLDQVFAVRATFGTAEELQTKLRQTRIELEKTFVGRAALTGGPLQEPDLRGLPLDAHQEQLFRAGWISMLAVPLLREDRIIGVLVVRRKRPGGYDDEIVDMLESFAAQSALAILNARVFRELERKGRELEIASRHKSEFLASMSHELRTPLNAVIGFSEVLLERMFGELNERQDEYLRDILGSGQHLLELLNDVLDLSKVEAGRMELDRSTFPIGDVIEYSLSMVRERALQQHIALERSVDPGVDELYADELLRIRQVIVNLVTNAVQVHTGRGPDQGGRHARRVEEVQITVTDTGPGIPEEDRERIFESFQQGGRAVNRQEGTGLGLTLSRRIVELHAGRMWLDTEVGEGSTFGVALPLTGAPAPLATPKPDESSDGPVVIVVDDDPGSQELLNLDLSGAGVRVAGARTRGRGSGPRPGPRPGGDHPGHPTARHRGLGTDVRPEGGFGHSRRSAAGCFGGRRALPRIGSRRCRLPGQAGREGRRSRLTGSARDPAGHRVRRATARQGFIGMTAHRILVVEDNEKNLKLVRDVLQYNGYEILEARSGEQGVELALAFLPHLVLMDLHLPGINGERAFQLIRDNERTSGIPIVALTASP